MFDVNQTAVFHVATKQQSIYRVIREINSLHKSSVSKLQVQGDGNVKYIQEIDISHEQKFVPDFKFVWCSNRQHYRVYIYVADRSKEKENAGYCICTVGSPLIAMGFVALYQFLTRNRANNKEQNQD